DAASSPRISIAWRRSWSRGRSGHESSPAKRSSGAATRSESPEHGRRTAGCGERPPLRSPPDRFPSAAARARQWKRLRLPPVAAASSASRRRDPGGQRPPSGDLFRRGPGRKTDVEALQLGPLLGLDDLVAGGVGEHLRDRKSTRLNSSHVKSSYAVFC